MIMKKSMLFLLIIVSAPVYSDDPCAVLDLGTAKSHDAFQNASLCESVNLPQKLIHTNELLARIIQNQEDQEKELQNLRTSLNASIVQLAEAVIALKAAMVELKNENDEWHKNTLTDSRNAINKIPSELAKEPALLGPVTAKVADTLSKSEEFIESVRKQTNP